MKISRILFVFIILMTVSGCDFFRKVAGRSTSADIEAKKAVIAKQELQQELQQDDPVDSLACVDSVTAPVADVVVKDTVVVVDPVVAEKAKADSVAAVATLAELNIKRYKYSRYKGASSEELSHRYYIMVGAFGDAVNADKHIANIQKNPDMEPVKIKFRNGLIAVGVCPRNKLSDIAQVAESVLLQAFCPMDAWILVND